MCDDCLDMAYDEAAELEGILERVREFVDYPGNWGTLDGRRRVLLDLLDGKEVEWNR